MEVVAAKPLYFTQIGLFEYSLVAYPDVVVSEKVLVEKQNLAKALSPGITSKTRPHITIANFRATESMEETIIRYTQRVCSLQPAFSVELNNYSGFPPHTIYLRVQNPQPFKNLAHKLKVVANYINSCSCPPASFKNHPHITISEKIPESLYTAALMEYAQKTFHEVFMLNQLVLLRRNNQYETCKNIQVFHLQPSDYKPSTNTLY